LLSELDTCLFPLLWLVPVEVFWPMGLVSWVRIDRSAGPISTMIFANYSTSQMASLVSAAGDGL
jgi:hypothetical protein